ncbi:hypothetical protein [Antarctobacter heliothermus]|uniref:Uncharacterized protein n=1 Tax=Antarctobacter heliothermus TaxID=74033 RepID=A0A239F974_9RHOB|nr:hypothetical protein [Antarctobacter heliothermus]SNS53446.1 hypothetical protein SAMN04488078_101912 [Antarctobacter heliothermus]
MSDPAHRGGAPVGYLSELAPVEAGAVLYLRLWCDGAEARTQVWSDFARHLGPAQGRHALGAFESLCDLCARHGRRPLMRHHVSCKCLGADESCFATFIGYASAGQREDAMLLAMTLVRPDMAMSLTGLAQEVGFALRKMTLADRRTAPVPPRHSLH